MSPEARRALALLAGSARTTKKRVRRASRTAVRNSDRFAVASATRPLPSFRRTGGRNPARVVRVNTNTGQQIRPPARRQASAVRFTAAGIPISGVRGIPAPTGGGGGRSLGGFIRNLAAGGIRTITGLPAGLVQTASAGADLALAPTQLGWSYVTGRLGAEGLSRNLAERARRSGENVDRTTDAIAADYNYRWVDPIRRGDLGDLASRFYDDPLPYGLDVASVVSAGGTGAGAAASRLSRAGRGGRLVQALANANSIARAGETMPFIRPDGTVGVRTITRTGGRARPDIVRRMPLNTSGTSRAEATVVVPRRPYSRNPVTRQVQKAGTRARDRVEAAVQARYNQRAAEQIAQGADAPSGLARMLSTQGFFDRAAKKATRQLKMDADWAAETAAVLDTEAAGRALRELDRRVTTAAGTRVRTNGLAPEQIATTLHAEGVLGPRAGRTGAEIRDMLAKGWRDQTVRRAKAGEEVTLTRRNVEAVESLPAHLLDLESDMPGLSKAERASRARVQKAVGELRALDPRQREMARRAYGFPAEQQAARGRVPSAVTLGGAEDAGKVARDLRRQARVLATEAAQQGDKAVRNRLRASARGLRRQADEVAAQNQRGPSPRVAKAEARLVDAQARLAEVEARVPTVRSKRIPDEVKAARRDVRMARTRLAREQRANAGLTRPVDPALVREGIYRPHRPLEGRGDAPPNMGKGRGAFSQKRVRPTSGYLMKTGNLSLDPALALTGYAKAADRAVGRMSADVIETLIKTRAFKEGDKVVTGKRAVMRARASRDVVLVNRAELQKLIRKHDNDLDLGNTKTAQQLADSELDALFPDAAKVKGASSDYVAIPKSVADEWRASVTGTRIPYYDRLIDYWRGGLLALSPRWYVNNLVGNALQYGLLTGGDLNAIRRAGRVRANMPGEVGVGTFINAEKLRGSGRFTRAMDKGYDFNNRIEQAWRRGAYFHRLRNQLRKEGVELDGLSDEVVAEVLDKAPPSVKAQAVREMELFLGDYSKMTRVEREVLRRVFPFYCVDQDTEALTQRGWVKGDDLLMTDLVVSRSPDGKLTFVPVEAVYIDDYQGPMYRLKSRGIDALVTPGHKFLLDDGTLTTVEDLRNHHRIQVMADAMEDYAEPVVSDAMVEVVGWAVTEGHYKRNASGNITTIEIAQKNGRPECDQIRAALNAADATWHEFLAGDEKAIRYFGVTGKVAKEIQQIAPRRVMTHDFLVALTKTQREILLATMIAADGSVASRGRHDRAVFVQKDEKAADAFVVLATLSGYQTYKRRTKKGEWAVTVRTTRTVMKEHLHGQTSPGAPHPRELPTGDYDGYVWCPKTPYGNFVCRRNGIVHITGNSWMRVIGRLTFTLPFRSPLRAKALDQISVLGNLINKPEDEAERYSGERGAIPLGNPTRRLQTTALNPFRTWVEPIEQVLGDQSPGMEDVLASMGGWMNPFAQVGISQVTGISPFTQAGPLAPPGFDGSVASFGSAPQRWNLLTGVPEEDRPRVPFMEAVAQTLPGASVLLPPLRTILARGQRTYDTAPTLPYGLVPGLGSAPFIGTSSPSVLEYAVTGDPTDVIYTPRNKPSSTVPRSSLLALLLGAFGSASGARVRIEDPAARTAAARRREAAYRRNALSTLKTRRKVNARG